MSFNPTQFKKFAILAAEQADSKKALDILLLDLSKVQSAISDYSLVLSANSQTHLNALSEAIEERMEDNGLRAVHKDGAHGGHWLVLDYGGFVVHIFHEAVRKFYSLERLWENAKKVSWNSKSKKKLRLK
ncbi:MAG: ribosome silencing factor [Elusimicrobia bacterium]|nr:ribosome silencing factor [Elusimicrobiota bacterium]